MNNLDYASFLEIALSDEVNRRVQRRIGKCASMAPVSRRPCRLEDFDWSASTTLDRRLLDAVVSLEFLDKHEHVLLVGPAGVGKRFLAQALGYSAVRAGHTVRFTHADDFFKAMAQARVDNSLDRTFRSFISPDLLILDDLGLHRLTATAVRRPLRTHPQPPSLVQLRHHQQPRRRRVAQPLRRSHPRQQRIGPVGQRQLPDRHRRHQLPGTAVATPRFAGRERSNCGCCQPWMLSRGFHRWQLRAMLLSIVSSFLMHAVNATLLGLPMVNKRW